jgi:hypothetical protein
MMAGAPRFIQGCESLMDQQDVHIVITLWPQVVAIRWQERQADAL